MPTIFGPSDFCVYLVVHHVLYSCGLIACYSHSLQAIHLLWLINNCDAHFSCFASEQSAMNRGVYCGGTM